MPHVIDFINLSSGLAWLNDPDGPTNDVRFVRIQSTACEQKRWNFIIEDLSHEFLLHAARGHVCRVWDTSARKPKSRALYQGIPWIRYALERRWFGVASEPVMVRYVNVETYFDECYRQLSDAAKKRLDYVGKFLDTSELRFETRCKQSGLDGRYAELAARLPS